MLAKRSLSLVSILFLTGILSACVTTTTGGFNVEPSEEAALEDYVQLAIAYYDNGDMVGARRHLNNAIAIDDRNSDVYNVLALIFQTEGDLDLAEENFEKSIRYNRDNSRARNNYGALLYSLEKYEEAMEQFGRVTQDTMYEGRAIAFENLGRSALPLGRLAAQKKQSKRFNEHCSLMGTFLFLLLNSPCLEQTDRNGPAHAAYFSNI